MEALCPYFGKCGGCSSQHIPYEQQLDNKLDFLRKQLSFENVRVFSKNPYHYRNRIDFVFHPSGLGLREKGKWDKYVDVQHCAIANEKVNNLLEEARSFFT